MPSVDADFLNQKMPPMAHILMHNPDLALDTHASLELGVDREQPGSALQAPVASFVSFAIGAVLPLAPWFVLSGTFAIVASITIGGLAALGLGAAIGTFTARSRWGTAVRQLSAAEAERGQRVAGQEAG